MKILQSNKKENWIKVDIEAEYTEDADYLWQWGEYEPALFTSEFFVFPANIKHMDFQQVLENLTAIANKE